ncbi:MAG: hypothetical protein ACM3ST_16810 [Bdellovibrio bacteriovorus]
MAELFATGRVVDLILVLMALEALLLGLLWVRTARGVPPIPLVVNLVAGALLLLALRAALTGAGPSVTGTFLGLALVAHLADLLLRWRRRAGDA